MNQRMLRHGGFVCLSFVVILAGRVSAQEPVTVKLPLKKVVLFNSGVGFFEHRSEIDGNAQVELRFNVDDVNDLLKSMVVQDQGGRVSTVSYGSKDPITKTLKTFAIDLTANPTLAQLLDQVRGEQVHIDAPNEIKGAVLGVERRKQKVGENEVIEIEVLNLLTDDGLRSVSLAGVGRIKLVNEQLDAELRQALTILAMGHATDKKTVTLEFKGAGNRPVRVGYIQESPIWKTSYRLVLADDESPFLQGWAIVENTTEEDWQDVDLTLVSGRPISFIMDLYQPLYVPRPVVEPELFASLRPQTYGQDLAAKEAEFAAVAESPPPPAMPGAAGMGGGMGGMAGAMGGESLARAARRGRVALDELRAGMNLREGVQSVAQAAEVGELFQYAIETPVSLPRQQSAMLSIVNGSVRGEKVSIYSPNVHAKHPLNGLKLINSTGLHLMQGPITVFDDGVYAGDAQIQDLPPGTERLISYALDLDTEVAPETKRLLEQLTSVKIVKGVLQASRKYRRATEYTVKNSGNRAKQVLIEYPFDASWTLTNPEKPAEKTRDLYRFALQAQPGTPAKLLVEEEQTVTQQTVLTNLESQMIVIYLNARVVSDQVKEALREVTRRRQQLSELAAQQQRLEAQIKTIEQEQARIRQNMQQLDRTGDLYTRYVKKFGEQESQIESIREQIRSLIAEQAKQQQALDSYLTSLTLD
ncbi:MAG: DUF4139 domain-containing protein [Planctomycetes bacterium]|nr:DUF4139 domain-containing protein [Planctomycetota bacterium]